MWNVAEIEGSRVEGQDSQRYLVFAESGATAAVGEREAYDILEQTNRADNNLAATSEDPTDKFDNSEIVGEGDGFYIVRPQNNYDSLDGLDIEIEGADTSTISGSEVVTTGRRPSKESKIGEPFSNVDTTDSNQNPETTTNGGEIRMTEVDTSYFEEQGVYALESLGEDPEQYDDEEIVEYGLAAELWLTENGHAGELDRNAIVGFATEGGHLDGMMQAKQEYQDRLDPDGLYDEIVTQTEDRAQITDTESVLVNQLSYFADRMSEGTERVAEAHERTEDTYDRAQRALDHGFGTIDTVVDRLLSARESKGLSTDSPEDLNREMVYRAVLDQSIDDASDNLETLAEEGELDWEMIRELEEEGQDRVGMSNELDELEEEFQG